MWGNRTHGNWIVGPGTCAGTGRGHRATMHSHVRRLHAHERYGMIGRVTRLMVMASFIGTLAAVTPLSAQVTPQVSPADSAAVLLEAASDFDARGDSEVAVALYRLIIRRFPDTPSATSAQQRLDEWGVTRSGSSGRTELQVWSALYGLWLGVAIPGMAEADGPEAYGAGLLLGGPAGFMIGRAAARGRPLSLGQARAITWGGTWGTWQGLGWAMALDLGGGEECFGDVCYVEDESARAVFGSMIAGGLTGIVVGNLLSKRDITDGLATSVNLGSLWGTWFGLAGGIIADLDGDGLWASTLIGGNVGLVATALAARRWRPSRSRARLVSIAGLIGGVGGAGIDLLVQPDDEAAVVGIPLATSIVGLFIGLAQTRDHPRDELDTGSQSQSLIDFSGGRWRLGTPLPGITRVPSPFAPQGQLAVTVPLFSLSF